MKKINLVNIMTMKKLKQMKVFKKIHQNEEIDHMVNVHKHRDSEKTKSAMYNEENIVIVSQ